jgi:glucose/sorbosone dehydrogenase
VRIPDRLILVGCVIAVSLTLAAPASAAELRLKRVGTFSEPVFVTSPPGDAGTLAVVERYGRVRLVRHGKVLRRLLVDLRGRVRITHPRPHLDQRGLFSLAFAPDYATSRRLYVDYVDGRGRLRVDELQRGERRHVLDLGRATTKHHGGQLQFGPDGLLYVSTGMGATPEVSQEPGSLRGKLLRLDPLVRPARPEVVALGLRNPWRFSFDRLTGALLIGEVGEDTFEEVDLLPAGAPLGVNFGWPVYEGLRLTPGSAPFAQRGPALAYRHGPRWCAVVGGYVARGHAPRAVAGRYVYGDVCSGRIWSAAFDGTVLSDGARVRAPRIGYLVSFGEDARGRLYAVSFQGALWRLLDRRG